MRITWDPERHLQEWYPDVRVIETGKLPPALLGCIGRGQRVIWLAEGPSEGGLRSTLAYEVGELEFGPFDPRQGRRRPFHDWASRLLVPFDDLLDG